MSIFIAILPIALAIAAGFTARATRAVPDASWPAIEGLAFRVLFPAILIHAIARAEFKTGDVGALTAALVLAVLLAGLGVLMLSRVGPLRRIGPKALSTVFQTTTRWNAFVALAAADLLAGPEVTALIAVSMAVMIPLINVGNIVVLAALLEAQAGLGRVLRAIVTNPLVIGCGLGIAANLSPVPLPGPILETLDIIGRAALGITLLSVGAGLRLDRIRSGSALAVTATALRLIGVPALFLTLAWGFGLSGPALMAGLLVTTVPAATNGYIVARAMGGDAELYADTLAWQTVLAMITIPLWLSIA